jgi:hypothetical protein
MTRAFSVRRAFLFPTLEAVFAIVERRVYRFV